MGHREQQGTAEAWQKPGHLLRDSAYANFRQGITTAEAGPPHAGALTRGATRRLLGQRNLLTSADTCQVGHTVHTETTASATHTHTPICTHTHIHMHIHAHTNIHTYTYTRVHTHTHTHIHIHIHTYTHTNTYGWMDLATLGLSCSM